MISKYRQIYEHFHELIERGALKPGDSLPSEREMSESFDVSRDTVRKAMQLLENNKDISKARGRESVVLKRNLFDFPISRINSFKEMAKQLQWKNVVTHVEDLSIIEAEGDIAFRLDAEEGEEVYRIKRVREIDGEAVIFDTDYFKRRFVPRLTRDICAGSIYEYIENELGIKIGIAQKIVTIEDAGREDRMYLDLDESGVVAVVTSITALESGEIFQLTESRHRKDKFRFTVTAHR